MGNAGRKLGDVPDEHTGLSPRQVKLVQDSWHAFCSANREYGVLLFLSLFIKHPEYLKLFPNFRGKPVGSLKDDPLFRAHGCAIGYHLTSMVDSLNDPPTFEVLARRNGAEHLKRKGVKPSHFEVMGGCVVDVLRAKNEKLMTPNTVEAWGKFLTCFVTIVKDVYDEAAAQRREMGGSTASSHVGQEDASPGASTFRTLLEAAGVANASSSPMPPATGTSLKKKPVTRKPVGKRIISSASRKPEDESKATMPSTALLKPDDESKDTSPRGKK